MRVLKLALVAMLAAFPATADTAAGHVQPTKAGATVGTLEISGSFARATLPNQPTGGGFMTIANTGAEDDRLIAVATDVASKAEVHEMRMDGDVMRMREVEGGLAIPAGATVVLEPGGYHLMLMGLTQPLVEGGKIHVTLTFEKAGTVVVMLDIGPRDAKAHHHGG